MRVKTLRHFDQFLNWSSSRHLKRYTLFQPVFEEKITVDLSDLRAFAERYGYFSIAHPLVGKVSTAPADLAIVSCLLSRFSEEIRDPDVLAFVVAEVLTKVLAYRDLKVGQRFEIPVVKEGRASVESFVVDQVFDLWHGMPAFGLKPSQKGVPALLVFRGTDLSLDSQRGWASVMSDLDIAGPGLSAFEKSRKKLRIWLQKMQAQNHKARVFGFSLGGALAAYTFIYENDWIDSVGSFCFNAPGVSSQVIDDWQILPENRQKGFISYVTKGDLVSKVGNLFGTVYELSLETPMQPLTAHTTLMSGQSFFIRQQVDVFKENLSR